MAVNNNFEAQVSAWVRKAEGRMLRVFREASKRTASAAQRRIPVDTGFARASIRGSLQSMPQINPSLHGEKGRTYADTTDQILVTIANARLGQTIYIGWTANYVGFLEHGHSKQAPSGFVRLAAMEWPRIVREVCAEARGRAGA